jgi:hypothetical protein
MHTVTIKVHGNQSLFLPSEWLDQHLDVDIYDLQSIEIDNYGKVVDFTLKDNIKKYCEIIGEKHFSVRPNKCAYYGYTNCTLHMENTQEDNGGWRMCCGSCKTPFYIIKDKQ